MTRELPKSVSFIRKHSLDEVPQFFNILKGDMSLVGPRAYYPDELREQQKKYPNTKNRSVLYCRLSRELPVIGKFREEARSILIKGLKWTQRMLEKDRLFTIFGLF